MVKFLGPQVMIKSDTFHPGVRILGNFNGKKENLLPKYSEITKKTSQFNKRTWNYWNSVVFWSFQFLSRKDFRVAHLSPTLGAVVRPFTTPPGSPAARKRLDWSVTETLLENPRTECPLVNVYIANWKITIFNNGKSTINGIIRYVKLLETNPNHNSMIRWAPGMSKSQFNFLG